MLRRMVPTLLLWLLAAVPFVASMPVADAQPACQFQYGFATLHDMIPGVVGECVENEWFNPDNGDGLQRTTNGLLIWHKADNWTGFTNGTTTWVDGPYGLQSRLATEQFAWESLADVTIPEPVSGTSAQPTPPPAPPVAAAPAPAAPAPVVVERIVEDNGNGNDNSGNNDNDDDRPSVALDISKDQVDRKENFDIHVSAHRDDGISKIWWWATGTDDGNLRDTHTHDCDDANPCRHEWQESTDEGGKTIRVHAQARDHHGRDSDEVTKEIRVR